VDESGNERAKPDADSRAFSPLWVRTATRSLLLAVLVQALLFAALMFVILARDGFAEIAGNRGWFPCTNLHDDSALRCSAPQFLANMLVAVVVLNLFTFGVPLALAWIICWGAVEWWERRKAARALV
jgi:hypothetical protein